MLVLPFLLAEYISRKEKSCSTGLDELQQESMKLTSPAQELVQRTAATWFAQHENMHWGERHLTKCGNSVIPVSERLTPCQVKVMCSGPHTLTLLLCNPKRKSGTANWASHAISFRTVGRTRRYSRVKAGTYMQGNSSPVGACRKNVRQSWENLPPTREAWREAS